MIDAFTPSEKNTGKLILSLGTKGGGKTHLALAYLKYAMKNKLYDTYLLVLPSYLIEADDSYGFINDKDDHVFVFETYDEVISAKLMVRQKKMKKKKERIFFLIDDASGERISSLNMDTSLKRLITSIRHYNTFLWIVAHASSGVLSTFLRSNVDILLLYNLTNLMLLEQIYEEFMSLHPDFRQFDSSRLNKKKFIDKFIEVHSKQYNAINMNLRTREIVYDINDLLNQLST